MLLAAPEAWAQLPRTMSYQGVLADAAGILVPDAVHTLTFTLYDAASGGSVVFAETQSVPVVRGVFNSILGSATAGGIPPGVAFDRAYFLGISVDGGAELVPRTALTASPYALRASFADAVAANGVGTAAVADLAITNAKIANNTIASGKIATTGAAVGQALIFDGATLVYGNPVMQLPYSATVNSNAAIPLLGVTNSGNGRAADFRITNGANTDYTLRATSAGLGTVLDVEQYNNAAAGDLAVFRKNGLNVLRIDWTGKGFFNGGTQTGGADVAEAFETAGPVSAYEPGDVLVIATTRNRTVERSTVAHSTRVAGVYATKPGVLLTEGTVDADQTDTVPMGIIGVIPTKVSGENGPIQRGDLLVTSSTPGHAMRAGAQPAAGTIIGKALEPFEGAGTGRINVLVSIR